jgi:site-specific DNA recombinase
MHAAIYARKSTDQNLPDEEKSVTRQVERARAFAARKGWTVADAHVYADDGISGAEFTKRPGFLRLMNALRPRAPFQILIMAEESRLGREQIETAWALKQLTQAGVQVWLYLDDRQRTLDSPTEKLLMSVAAFADELERDRARQRTYDALERKARALHVTGGRVYGYDNVEVRASDGRRLHVVRQVNPEQAAVVRRIFALRAEGQGFTRIAKALNEDRVAPPRRSSGWAPTAVREILLRPLYRGEVVWNRLRKRDRWGVKRYLARRKPNGCAWTRRTCGSCPRRSGRPRISG